MYLKKNTSQNWSFLTSLRDTMKTVCSLKNFTPNWGIHLQDSLPKWSLALKSVSEGTFFHWGSMDFSCLLQVAIVGLYEIVLSPVPIEEFCSLLLLYKTILQLSLFSEICTKKKFWQLFFWTFKTIQGRTQPKKRLWKTTTQVGRKHPPCYCLTVWGFSAATSAKASCQNLSIHIALSHIASTGRFNKNKFSQGSTK